MKDICYNGVGINENGLKYAKLENVKKIAHELTGKSYDSITDLDGFKEETFECYGDQTGLGALFAALLINKKLPVCRICIRCYARTVLYEYGTIPYEAEKAFTAQKLNDIFMTCQDELGIPKSHQQHPRMQILYEEPFVPPKKKKKQPKEE